MTYQEVIYRTITEAQRGGVNFEQLNLDAQGMAEAQMPVVLQAVAEKAAASERKRGLLRQTVSVPFTAGVGAIPTYILTQYIEDGTLFDPANLTTIYSFVKNFNDFIDSTWRLPPFSGYGYYSIIGGDSLAVTEPGVNYDPANGITANRSFNALTVPQIPATPTSTLVAVDEIIADIIDAGSEMLRGAVAKTNGAKT